MSNFASRIRECRIAIGQTQAQSAANIGVAWRTWQDYEAGKRAPTLGGLIALADYFDVSLDYLVGRSDNPKRV